MSKKEKIIAVIAIFFVVISVAFIIINVKSENRGSYISTDKINLKKSEYSLDELYGFVKDNSFKTKNLGYLYTHFYEYFNQDTKFLIISEYDVEKNEVVSTEFIDYNQYMKVMKPIYESLKAQDISNDDTIWDSITSLYITFYFKEKE